MSYCVLRYWHICALVLHANGFWSSAIWIHPTKRGLFVPFSGSWICCRLLIAGSFESIGLQNVSEHFFPSNIALAFTYSLWGPPFRDNLRSVRNTVDQARPVMSSPPVTTPEQSVGIAQGENLPLHPSPTAAASSAPGPQLFP